MNKIKFNWKSYFKPTPKLIRKAGDSLLLVSTFISSYGIIEGHTELAITALIIGVIGKFLSNFFKDEE